MEKGHGRRDSLRASVTPPSSRASRGGHSQPGPPRDCVTQTSVDRIGEDAAVLARRSADCCLRRSPWRSARSRSSASSSRQRRRPGHRNRDRVVQGRDRGPLPGDGGQAVAQAPARGPDGTDAGLDGIDRVDHGAAGGGSRRRALRCQPEERGAHPRRLGVDLGGRARRPRHGDRRPRLRGARVGDGRRRGALLYLSNGSPASAPSGGGTRTRGARPTSPSRGPGRGGARAGCRSARGAEGRALRRRATRASARRGPPRRPRRASGSR
jgi:hypothetical protein